MAFWKYEAILCIYTFNIFRYVFTETLANESARVPFLGCQHSASFVRRIIIYHISKDFFWCIAAAYVVMHLWSLVAGKLAALYWPRDQMKSVIRRTNDALNLTIQTFPE